MVALSRALPADFEEAPPSWTAFGRFGSSLLLCCRWRSACWTQSLSQQPSRFAKLGIQWHRLHIFYQQCLHWFLRITYHDLITNKEMHRCTCTLHSIGWNSCWKPLLVCRTHPPTAAKSSVLVESYPWEAKTRTAMTHMAKTLHCTVGLPWDEVLNVATDRARWGSLCARCAAWHRRNSVKVSN